MDNPWKLIRELAEIIRNDDTDALDYIDKNLSFEGIATEDYYDFYEQMMKYRQWLSDFEALYKENQSDEAFEIPPTKTIGREEFMSFPKNSIAFIEITEAGGMGNGGNVFFITDTLESREFNFVYGDITENDIFKKFPEFRITFSSYEKKPPRGWRLLYMGMGNTLIYRAKYEKGFVARCDSFGENTDLMLGNRFEMAYDTIYSYGKE